MLLLAVLLNVIPGSDMIICKLNAPSGASNGVWPGSVMVLNCTILQDGPVEYITWKKDGDVLRNTSIVSPGQSLLMWEALKLEDLSDKDDGQYSCVAVKGIHSQEDWYTLNIFAKPHIIPIGLTELELRYGDRFSVTCSASGWPKPNITWTKHGNKYMESSHVLKSPYGLKLQFLFARLTDKGLYACHANNTIGSDLWPVLVKVKPVQFHMRSVKVTTPYKRITVYENQNISLECRASDIDNKHFASFWKHDGKSLTDPERKSKVEVANHLVLWYKIVNVTLKDAGSYTCGVQTDMGEDNQVIGLNVKRRGPPRVSSKNPTIFSKLGSSATLSCTLQYADIADVIMEWTQNHSQWFYTHSRYYNIEHKDPRNGNIIYSLVIRNVTVKDLGCYNCDVKTSLGSCSSTVCLQLKQTKKEIMTIYASSSAGPLWKTTVPVFLVCLVVCVAGFIAGFYARKNRIRRPGFQDNSGPRATDGYQYDVFITFSSKDFLWVKTELIPLIEKHNLNYCIHNRDFQPGKNIVDNMADSVYNSRRILAVLSKNYMSSTFCRGELDMALCRNTLRNDSSLIAIRVDEIEKKRLPKALQGNTFLDYYNDQEKNLWEIRLAKQLALKEEEENTL
ncbi:hemicentin-1-like isoform X2 [Actinia tenebrosa]|uniref:Soluble interferon alpha/beta receptor OPG204 n=1 Tax=Actinia tenebrosa TaxID=6105 RepID=A0A6P8HM32_ACTTE|nr:hemicentin-1-like isoform X2 [Actinia tenebrosa]